MSTRPVIGGMWGTTRLALYLLDATSGATIASRSGPGVSKVRDSKFEDALFECCAPWIERAPDAKIVMSGMVGSTIGWSDVPYLDCPADVSDIPKHCKVLISRGHRIHIAPGLACTNALGQPDVMRGEETELLGWVNRHGGSTVPGRRFVCIPGTHAKWVEIQQHRIVRFLTGVTGELFDVLCTNGVLTTGSDAGAHLPGKPFFDGLSSIAKCPEYLLSRLFSVRANVVRGRMDPEDAPEFMSGLLVGADVAGAVTLLGLRNAAGVVSVIGTPNLSQRYACALEHCGVSAMVADASLLAPRGLFLISNEIERS